MNTTSTVGCTPQSAATGLLLAALQAHDIYDQVRLPGLVPDAVLVHDRDTIIAATMSRSVDCARSLAAVAAEHHLDVILLRLAGAGAPIMVDLALGALPCSVWTERDWALYRDGQSTWLVPPTFGPAVSITVDGARLEITTPYASLAERSAGVARAAADLARLLQPVEA